MKTSVIVTTQCWQSWAKPSISSSQLFVSCLAHCYLTISNCIREALSWASWSKVRLKSNSWKMRLVYVLVSYVSMIVWAFEEPLETLGWN